MTAGTIAVRADADPSNGTKTRKLSEGCELTRGHSPAQQENGVFRGGLSPGIPKGPACYPH